MSSEHVPVDGRSFAARRELRDILARLISRTWWRPKQYEQALARLGEQRRLALRQIILIFREGRVSDELAALDILSHLARTSDDALLAEVANDSRALDGARVACALVLLGHDRSDLLSSPDISGLVLRWQARYVAEEPGMREPLVRLYKSAPPDERARWILLQEQELREPSSRAAVFEMLLKHEKDAELRLLLIQALSRVSSPCARAALRRIEPRFSSERESITGLLTRGAGDVDPERVPEGWSAKVGFCDGSGIFPLRMDRIEDPSRDRSVIFLIDLDAGIREVLSLIGSEIARYDRDTNDEERSVSAMVELPVREALFLLHDAEQASARAKIPFPSDYEHARQLLDPLADLKPSPLILPEPGSVDGDAARSSELFVYAGYSGWFYDAGDHLLDDLRLEVLESCDPASPPSDELIDLAATRLHEAGEAERIAARLEHNAMIHARAGDKQRAAIAQATAQACRGGGFGEIPLLRRIIRESLHPGHYFFAPVPDRTQRSDLALLLLNSSRPTRSRVLAVDLAWILTRAADVWLSRVPSSERPPSDQIQSATLELAHVGARWIVNWMSSHGDPEASGAEATRITFGPWRDSLRERYRDTLREMRLFRPRWDEAFDRLSGLLVWASESLVFRICLSRCQMQCPIRPRHSGVKALEGSTFPAGSEAEAQIRTWPGLYFQQPTSRQEGALQALLEASQAAVDRPSSGPFYLCGVCDELRPTSTRSRSRLIPLEGGPAEEVCRRCQGRYRRDPAFRSKVTHNLGRLMS